MFAYGNDDDLIKLRWIMKIKWKEWNRRFSNKKFVYLSLYNVLSINTWAFIDATLNKVLIIE